MPMWKHRPPSRFPFELHDRMRAAKDFVLCEFSTREACVTEMKRWQAFKHCLRTHTNHELHHLAKVRSRAKCTQLAYNRFRVEVKFNWEAEAYEQLERTLNAAPRKDAV